MPSSRSPSPISASESPGGTAEPAIVVRGLTMRVDGRVVLENLDLEVRRGEVLGVVGASGAGKSVLLRALVGLLRPSSGRITILGEDRAALGAEERRSFDARFGVLFQDGALFSSLSVAQNIQVPLREHLALSDALISELTRLKLAVVARALALDPELLFLDEPTAGLDPIAAAEFDALIADLKRSMHLTVLMVTHDLDSLAAICDRIAVLVDRRLVVGTLDELLQHPHPWIRSYFAGPRGRAAQRAAG